MAEEVEKVLWWSGCCRSLRRTCPSNLIFRSAKISVKGLIAPFAISATRKYDTPLKFNSSPLKRERAPKGMYSSNHHISGAIQVMASSKTEKNMVKHYSCYYKPYQTHWFYNSCLCLCQVQHLHTYVSVHLKEDLSWECDLHLEDLAGHHVALPRGSKSHYINLEVQVGTLPSRLFLK